MFCGHKQPPKCLCHTAVGVYRFSCAGPGPGLDPVGSGTGSGRLRVRPGPGPGPRVGPDPDPDPDPDPGPGPGPDAGPVPDQLRLVGCSGHRMLLAYERIYVLGMDALVTVCSSNTNGLVPWAWMLWSPHALGTRTDLCLGHGCSGHRMLLEHERNYALGMDALVTVCSALGVDALVTVWSLNTNGIMRWAWMLWSPYALGTRTELCVGHGCSGHRMLFNTNGKPTNVSLKKRAFRWTEKSPDGCYCYTAIILLLLLLLLLVCSWNTSGIMLWAWMLWSQSLNTNGIMRWAWMLWSPYALGTRRELCVGHGCSGHRMLFNTNGKPTNVSLKKRAFRWTEKSPDGCYCYTAILLYCYTAILLYCYYTTTTTTTATTTTTTTTRRIRAQPVRVGL